MITDNVQVFWAELQRGEFIGDAAVAAGTYRKQGTRWVIANGGVRPRGGRGLKGRCLSFVEREQIAISCAAGGSVRTIAAQLGRSPSTISRELRRNREAGGGYRASSAHAMAYQRASRPKPAKLAVNMALREKVEQDLEKKYSPEQITGRLLVEFPDDPEMRVSAETIYQSLYVQSRGALRRDLAVCLRTGRALRRPSRKVGQRKNRLDDQVRELLADDNGGVAAPLEPLRQALANVERPATVLEWLRRSAAARVLADFGRGVRPLTHHALDELGPDKAVEHLRSVLVATGTLPERDEQLVRLGRWITATIGAETDPERRHLLHHYVVWHLLRRLRTRNRGRSTTYGQATPSASRCAGPSSCSTGLPLSGSPSASASRPTWTAGWPATRPATDARPAGSCAGP